MCFADDVSVHAEYLKRSIAADICKHMLWSITRLHTSQAAIERFADMSACTLTSSAKHSIAAD